MIDPKKEGLIHQQPEGKTERDMDKAERYLEERHRKSAKGMSLEHRYHSAEVAYFEEDERYRACHFPPCLQRTGTEKMSECLVSPISFYSISQGRCGESWGMLAFLFLKEGPAFRPKHTCPANVCPARGTPP